MSRMSNSVILSLFILCLFFIQGCISSKKTPQIIVPEQAQHYALSNDTLDKRIENIKNSLKQNDIPSDKTETVLSFAKAYQELKSLNKKNSYNARYKRSLQTLFNSLTTIEDEYLFQEGGTNDDFVKKVINKYSDLKKQIIMDYASGNYSGVLSGCDEIVSRYGKSGLTPEIGALFAISLSKYNMLPKAMSIASGIINELVESRPDLIDLLKHTIDWELEMGNKENAGLLYEKLVDEINETNRLYKEAGNLIFENQNSNQLLKESTIENILKMDPTKEAYSRQFLNDINNFLEQKDFAGARLQLIRWQMRAEEGPEIEMIEKVFKSVDKAEEEYLNEQGDEKYIIGDAEKLIEEERYQEAIDLLEPLIAAGSNYEAEKVKDIAVERLIDNEISRAAKILMAARKENKPQKRNDLLLSSKSILNNLIEQYPLSPSINRYIAIVDNELAKLPYYNE